MTEFDKIAMKGSRGFLEFQSNNEYVEAMVEDLSDWLNYLYNLQGDDQLTPDNFFKQLNNGVILCKHANLVQSLAEEFLQCTPGKTRELPMKIGNQTLRVPLQSPTFTVVDFSKNIFRFHARDNVSNFISWCRGFNIPASLTFETDDLVALKNPRNVVVALLEVARIGTIFGMEVPDIIQLEQEIDDEINQCGEGKRDIPLPVVGNNRSHKDSETMTDSNCSAPGIGVIKTYCDIERNSNCNQKNNSSIDINDRKKVPAKLSSFGFRGRRASLNIPKDNCPDQPDPVEPLCITKGDLEHHVIRKTNSVCFDSFDNSDNDSNFSQNSHSKFLIPKYKMNKPVGRVKIYDGFDRSNYVKEKKCREKVDLRSLDERVREILSQCQCEELFLMKRIGEGRYQWGDKKIMIFIRILRSHVMVRVGGGWNTLGDFLYKHDPCRREKCDNFKFCLPTNHKKTLPTSTDEKSPLNSTPSSISPKTAFYSPQVHRKNSKRDSFNSGDGGVIRMLKEEMDETDDIINKENVIESEIESVTKVVEDITRSSDCNNGDSPVTKITDIKIRNNPVLARTLQNREMRSVSMSLPGYPKNLLATFHKKTIKQSRTSDNTMTVLNADSDKKKSSRIPRLKF